MSKAVAADVLDAALAEVATATRLVLCSAEPANFAGIAAVALADVTLTAGDGGGDYTIANGDVSGRKVSVGAQTGFTIDASGTATHVTLDDGVALQFVTTCSSQALTSGGTVSVASWDIELSGKLLGVAPGVTAEFYSIFEGSDWTDNGKWSLQAGNGGGDPDQIFSIFTTSLDADVPGGRGWRSQQVSTWWTEMYQVLETVGGPSTPAVGEITSWRHFTKLINCDTDGNYHSVDFGAGNGLSSQGTGGFTWYWVGSGAGPYQLQFALSGSTGNNPFATVGSPAPGGEWLRFEYNWERLTSTTWDLNIRVYENVGVGGSDVGDLLLDESDFISFFATENPLPDYSLTYSPASDRTIMAIGVPGLEEAQAVGYEMERHAAFAAITDSVAHTSMPYGYFDHET